MFRNGQYIRTNLLYDAYIEAMEAHTTSDFPTFLAERLHKIMLAEWAKANSAFRRIVRVMNLTDFKNLNVYSPFGEADDLLAIGEAGEYAESTVRDVDNVQMRLGTYGRTFSLSRQSIINDEFNKLTDQPARFGRAARRTLARNVISTLTSPGNAYDGVAFFGDHKQADGVTTAANNLLGTSPLSRTTLRAAIERFQGFKDNNGVPLALTPSFLYVPISLGFTAKEILGSPELIGQGSNAVPATNLNVMQNVLPGGYVVDPYLPDDGTWYLFADPAEIPAFGLGFLNGVEEPALMLKDPAARLVLGGNDPYSFEFDEIKYKVRHDWVVKPIEPRGVIKATVS